MKILKEYKFSDLYEMSSGISSTKEQAGHGAPFVSFSTVFNNYILPDELPDRMDTSRKEQETYSIKKGDIFITRTSETLDELAMSSVALKDYPNATFSGFVKRLRPLQDDVTYDKFMAFYLRSSYFRKIIQNNTNMTLRASFNEDIFSYLTILLPDYKEQKKIGDYLFVIEEKIKINSKLSAKLEEQAKLLFNYWFLQFEFPNEDGKPYKTSGGALKYNNELKIDIPKGWRLGQLSEVSQITMGSSPKGENLNETEKGIIFYQGKADFGNRFPRVRMYTDSPTRYANEDDVLLSVRAPVGSINVAEQKCCIGRGLAAIHGKYPSFTLYLLKVNEKQFKKYNNVGTTFGSITKEELHDFPIIIPPEQIMEMFDEKIKPIDALIKEYYRQNQILVSYRNKIVPLLINGQVKLRQ